jgi:hypothetical protein
LIQVKAGFGWRIDMDQQPPLVFDYSRLTLAVNLADASQQGGSMDDHDVIGQAEFDEEIPAFDVPDDALEQAASAEWQATTWVYCTHPWYYCPWPQ